jgi:hypothetical protein
MTGKDRRQVRLVAKGRGEEIRREEIDRLVDILNERGEMLNRILQEQRIHFERMAQLQAELDRVKQELARLKSEV